MNHPGITVFFFYFTSLLYLSWAQHYDRWHLVPDQWGKVTSYPEVENSSCRIEQQPFHFHS